MFFSGKEENMFRYVSHFDGILWADEQGWLVHYMYLALQRLFYQQNRLEKFLTVSLRKGKTFSEDFFHQNKFAALQLETGAAYSLRSRSMEYFLLFGRNEIGGNSFQEDLFESMSKQYPDSSFLYSYVHSPEFLQFYNSCRDVATQQKWEQLSKNIVQNQYAASTSGVYFFLKGGMVALRNRKSKIQYNSVAIAEGWEEVEVLGIDATWVSVRCLGEKGFLDKNHLIEQQDFPPWERKMFRNVMKFYQTQQYLQAASDLAYLIRKGKNLFIKERAVVLLHKVQTEIRRRAESRNNLYTKYVLMHSKYFSITKEGLLGDSFLLFNFLKKINMQSPFFRLFQYQT